MGAVLTELVQCENPVFVIGSPRSGTSVLAWSLAHHPSFWTSRETHFLDPFFSDGIPTLFERSATADSWLLEEGVDRREFTRYVGAGLNALFTSRSAGRRWVDQTPANTMVLGELASTFPGATFVHALRDGRSVVHSMRHFTQRLGSHIDRSALPTWTLDFETAVRTWSSFVGAATEFAESHPDRCTVFRLEDAAADPVSSFRRLLSFLDEPYNNDLAAFFSSGRINSSFGDAEGYACHGQPAALPWDSWTEPEREHFSAVAGGWLGRLGYALADSPAPSGR